MNVNVKEKYIGFNVRFNPNLEVIAAGDALECE